jgi:arylsulfatase A-like enzyme
MSRPNIVFILADDMGYGDFSAFNEGRTHTPAIDSLVSDGICLTHHYAAAPACTPARAALLTGRYHHRTGAIDMRELMGLSRLSLKETTIADVFKANGYATGLVGKWHNGAIGRMHTRL